MDHIIKTIKESPFIDYATFLGIGGLEEETNINRRVRDFILEGKQFPLDLLKQFHETLKLYYDMLLEALEDPESTMKLKKYLNYSALHKSIKENTLDSYLDSLDNLDKYIEDKILSYGNTVSLSANNRISIENLLENPLLPESSLNGLGEEILKTGGLSSLSSEVPTLSEIEPLPIEFEIVPSSASPSPLSLESKIKPYRQIILKNNNIKQKSFNEKVIDFLANK